MDYILFIPSDFYLSYTIFYISQVVLMCHCFLYELLH